MSTRVALFSMAGLAFLSTTPVVLSLPEGATGKIMSEKDPSVEFKRLKNEYMTDLENQLEENQNSVLSFFEKKENEDKGLEVFASQHDDDAVPAFIEKKAEEFYERNDKSLSKLAVEQPKIIRSIDQSYIKKLLRLKMILGDKMADDSSSQDKKAEETADLEYLVASELAALKDSVVFGKICFNFVGASGEIIDKESSFSFIDAMNVALNLAFMEQGIDSQVIESLIGEQNFIAAAQEKRRGLRAKPKSSSAPQNPERFLPSLQVCLLLGVSCATHSCPTDERPDFGEAAITGDEESSQTNEFFSSNLEKSMAEKLRRQVGGVFEKVVSINAYPCRERNNEDSPPLVDSRTI